MPVTCWSNADLLTCVTGRSTPCILPPWEQDLLGLATHTEMQISRTLDLSPTQTTRLMAAMEIARRLVSVQAPPRSFCRSAEDVAVIMRPMVIIDHERLWCLALDPHMRLMGSPIEVARGDVDGTDASARAVCRAALRARAVSMTVVHNHPNGDPTPSPADIAVTRHLVAAGRAVEVPLVDHVIVTSDGGFSSLRRDYAEIWT